MASCGTASAIDEARREKAVEIAAVSGYERTSSTLEIGEHTEAVVLQLEMPRGVVEWLGPFAELALVKRTGTQDGIRAVLQKSQQGDGRRTEKGPV
jgi:hypothetical protein